MKTCYLASYFDEFMWRERHGWTASHALNSILRRGVARNFTRGFLFIRPNYDVIVYQRPWVCIKKAFFRHDPVFL